VKFKKLGFSAPLSTDNSSLFFFCLGTSPIENRLPVDYVVS